MATNHTGPAATGNLDANFTTTTVPVPARRTVCYEFDTRATAVDLALPYLVSIDGQVQGPDTIRKLGKNNRKITLSVSPGCKVALYLNSDVHPAYRCQPVYAVDVNERDVLVRITEQKGRINHALPIVGKATNRLSAKPGAPPVECYQALLTGDIWMMISHRYTAAEAEALLPPDTHPVVRIAVRKIYTGLAAPELLLQFSASDSRAEHLVKVKFLEAENVQANITHCPLLTDVLPRTHPCAYGALLTEAYNTGVTEILVTSCWRPMLGSIAHRAGLGLDVAYLAKGSEKIHINRAGLLGKHGSHNDNVSTLEKTLYEEYEAAKQRAENGSSEKAERKAEQKAKAEWDAERDKNEPKPIHELRERLRHHQSISQVFDPWYMEVSTQSRSDQVANEQRSQNEKIHNNHMHITIKEPKIL